MKKNYLLTLLLFTAFFGFSQFAVTVNGTNINDNDYINVGTTDSSADREFIITNLNTTNSINALVKVESITNSNGDHLTLCFDLCYYGVTVGNSYPLTGPVAIAPSSTSAPHGNHFLNEGFGDDATNPITYELKFYEVDAGGNEIGTPITLFYRFNPTLALNDYDQVNFELYPNVTTTNFTLKVEENVHIKIYSIQGKLVQENNATIGNNTIDVSKLTSQLYFVEITNQDGKKSVTKLIIK